MTTMVTKARSARKKLQKQRYNLRRKIARRERTLSFKKQFRTAEFGRELYPADSNHPRALEKRRFNDQIHSLEAEIEQLRNQLVALG